MDRLRIRRSPASRTRGDSLPEQQMSERPQSLHNDEASQDALEVLLDDMPSVSLPATPLTKRREDPVNFSPPSSPHSVDVEMLLGEDTSSPRNSQLPTQKPVFTYETPASETLDSEENVGIALEKFKLQRFTWDEINEILESQSSETNHDVLPEEGIWTTKSSGIEQLRAFLEVCD